jgi:hypothetical protein
MKFQKQLTINIGGYESIRLGIEDAPSYEDCDKALTAELHRINIPLSNKIKQCIHWPESSDETK